MNANFFCSISKHKQEDRKLVKKKQRGKKRERNFFLIFSWFFFGKKTKEECHFAWQGIWRMGFEEMFRERRRNPFPLLPKTTSLFPSNFRLGLLYLEWVHDSRFESRRKLPVRLREKQRRIQAVRKPSKGSPVSDGFEALHVWAFSNQGKGGGRKKSKKKKQEKKQENSNQIKHRAMNFCCVAISTLISTRSSPFQESASSMKLSRRIRRSSQCFFSIGLTWASTFPNCSKRIFPINSSSTARRISKKLEPRKSKRLWSTFSCKTTIYSRKRKSQWYACTSKPNQTKPN